jgi:hypothetical protein
MKKILLLTSAAVAGLLFPAVAHAQILSVQFPSYYSNPYNTLNGSAGGGPSETSTAGVLPADNWNDAMGPSTAPDTFVPGDGVVTGDITNANLFTWVTNPEAGGAYPNGGNYTSSPTALLLTSTGGSSSVLFDLSGAGTERGNNNQAEIGGSYGSPDSQLASGGALQYGSSGSVALSFANLNPNDYYVLVAYLDFDYYSMQDYFPATNSYNYGTAEVSGIGSNNYYVLSGPQNTLTAWTQATATSSASATIANYVEYQNVLGSTLESDSLTINDGGGFAGFQLEDVGSTPAVPEPSTVWMFSLGFLGLMVHVYRRRYART